MTFIKSFKFFIKIKMDNDWLQTELEGKTVKKIYSNDYGFVVLTHENKVIEIKLWMMNEM
jgi:hypothetical protein